MLSRHLIRLLVHYKYAAIFPVAVIEGPAITVLSGVLVSLGYLSFAPALLVVFAGDLVSDPALYAARDAAEFAYADVFHDARRAGLRTVYVAEEGRPMPGREFRRGRITPAMIAKEIPDFAERTFYLSGPRAMVEAFTDALRDMGVKRRRVKTDFFPGFA